MKILQIPLLLGLVLGFNAELVKAQNVIDQATTPALTREQVKKDRDDFIKTHRYDPVSENWVLRKEFEPPTGMKTRAQVKAERDEFIKTHRYDNAKEEWVPLNDVPKATLSRAQVRAEAAQFIRSYQWDDTNSVWVKKPVSRKK
jgi:hypothetical protein